MKVIITAEDIQLTAELDDSPTAKAIAAALPLEGRASKWGDEIYFNIPVRASLSADASALVQVGDLAYWPEGSMFCLFFGPTPASVDQQPQAYGPVNVFGRVSGDATILRSVPAGAVVSVSIQSPQ